MKITKVLLGSSYAFLKQRFYFAAAAYFPASHIIFMLKIIRFSNIFCRSSMVL